MSDFLLDFRPREQRRVASLADRLRFLPHINVSVLQTPRFDLAVSCPDNISLWGHFANSAADRIVAVAGRVALTENQWEMGGRIAGQGGLACKALDQLYAHGGVEALQNLSGNFVIMVWNGAAGTFHLVTDCTGVFPAYEFHQAGTLVLGSHPDILAAAAGESENVDELSLAEFAITSAVSPPFTYYRNIRAVGRAMTVSITVPPNQPAQVTRRCHFPLEFRGVASDHEDHLAEELAAAFPRAVALRSTPRLGRCAVALSGGLDSRAVLASLADPSNAFAFTCYDRENQEFQSAAAIARAAGVEFFPRQRPFDYYADNASFGMRVAGGMGSIANNHFLGTLPWLREQGAGTFLTGCYCDYLFKGLPLNRRTHPLTGHETLAPYRREFYFNQYWPRTKLGDAVRDRIDARFPATIINDPSDAAVFELEQRRTFPLCYEADNAQRLVPQRLSGWFVPVSDPDLMRLYCRIPYRWKLNRSIFRKAVNRICGPALTRVPDANTGAGMNAPWWREAMSWTSLRLRNRLQQLKPSLATNGSWQNWHYYVAHSRKMASLWSHPNHEAADFFQRAFGHNHLSPNLGSYQGGQLFLMIQLLSLKLWMEQRVSTSPPQPERFPSPRRGEGGRSPDEVPVSAS